MRCYLPILLTLLSAFFVRAETKDTDTALVQLKAKFVVHYATLLHAEYEDSLRGANALQSAISVFLDKPSPAAFQAVREVWIRSRKPYLQTEISRFYDGPIEAVEGFINAWPIDENYIDYTDAGPDSGIINQPAKFPAISRDVLLEANEKEGEKNISVGFHAIEFLLWGQDLNDDGPGQRSYLDYVEGSSSQARNAVRRREYLRLAAGLLTEHLGAMVHEWAPDQPANYRARFLSMPPEVALANIFKGLGSLSGAELSGERLLVPYTTKEQEDEHSCFSDTTHLDLLYNQIGIQNIYLGRYTREDGVTLEGPGLHSLLEEMDSKSAATLKRQIEESAAALKTISRFDQAIRGRDVDPGRVAIKKSLDALQAQTTSLAKAASTLGIRLNLP